MRVKRLEIQGFKSFKDKTVVHFDHTITGIVGPNGCGKSNIVDAFFWVMGEQSYKHMRGSGSEDLIFNGSSRYSPLGMAEATLVLETDVPDLESTAEGSDLPAQLKTKEISVTRRVYRSGEGEYFINGVPARLKDIHELFMDTGVGAKGYSVIEQGQIGKIVQAKPEERRLLIEEAAGIAKYKARKKESLRKMEATQGNLSRLTDVIAEIERNLNSLERQAQKARQYKKYREELLEKEMTWGRRKAKVLRQRLDALKKEREGVEQDLLALRAELQTAENSMESDQVNQVTETKLAEDLQRQIQDLSGELHQRKSALELSRRRQGDLATQLETLESEQSELTVLVEEGREKIASHEAESEEANVAFETIQSSTEEQGEAVRALRSQAEQARRALDQAKRDLLQGISQSSELTSRAATLASRAENARANAERLAAQAETVSERLATARTEAAEASTRAEELKTRRETLRAERQDLASRVQEQEQASKQADRARNDAQRELTQLRSRLQSLEELQAAHEGFGDGPKAALDWARENGATDGLRALADAFDVTPGFETAVEAWLGDRLEGLFAESSEVALGALEALRDQKVGRIAVQLARKATATAAGSAGEFRTALEGAGFQIRSTLAEAVRVNQKLGADAGQTLQQSAANVFVVETLNPTAVGKLIAHPATATGGFLVVGLDGSALDPATGWLTGGSSQSSEAGSLLGRKRAIAELEAQVADSAAKAESAENAANSAREALEMARTRMQALQTEVQEIEVEAAGIDRDVHQMSRTVRELESQESSTLRERENSEQLAAQAEEERAEITTQIEEIVSSRTSLEDEISAREQALSTVETQVSEADASLSDLRVREASLRERANSLKRELDGARSVLGDRERRLTEIARALDRANREQNEHSGGDGELHEKIEALTLDLAERKEQLSLVRDRLEQQSAKLKSVIARIKELHEEGDEASGRSNQLAIEYEKLSAELSHLVQNLEEKYGPGCLEIPVVAAIQEEMSDPVITTEMSAEEEAALSEEVERLRERIRRLGEVNVGAIEEFEEVQKRYEHIVREKLDLERSLENLQEAIDHINRTSEERFKKAFEAIADRFERLFPIIFGGGQAKLTLVYPEGSADVLEAGVDILAQPPGKKIVNMHLLSGGEKALTALSFIFAIFMVKPSPFCLLDEVDAPLDDANIGKFNALLREMSAKSQFIIITHNKKTMELNDTLFGVTMEEPGVSKVVSIQLH